MHDDQGLPLYWRDGALRLRIVAQSSGTSDAGISFTVPPGSWNGALVDSGSRDIVLHSAECVPCGGSALAAVAKAGDETEDRGDGTAKIEVGLAPKFDPEDPGGRGTSVRHLADGREWLRASCGSVHVFDGLRWTPLAVPRGMQSACVPFHAVVHREPAKGYERVSRSRSGTFGIAPGSMWQTPLFVAVQRELAQVTSPDKDVLIGSLHLASMCKGTAVFAQRIRQTLSEMRCAGRLVRLSPGHNAREQPYTSSYRVRAHDIVVEVDGVSARGRGRRIDGASGIDLVIDTGSSMLYVPELWWRRIGGGEHGVRIVLEREPHDPLAAQEHEGLADCFDKDGLAMASINVSSRNMSMIPAHLPVPSNTWLLGSKALAGKCLLFYPGNTHTGRGAFVCISQDDRSGDS